MTPNNDQRKEALENWKRQAEKADKDADKSISAQRIGLGIVFGATALSLGSLKLLPVTAQDVVLLIGTAITASGTAIGFAVNHIYAVKTAFYKAVNEYCDEKYSSIINNEIDLNDYKNPTYRQIKQDVAKTFDTRKTLRKPEYLLNQSTIIGTFAAATVGWYLSTRNPVEAIIASRPEESIPVIEASSPPEVMDTPPTQPALVPAH
jgi:hypothetical protein